MGKIKPLSNKHSFRRFLRRLFGRKPRHQFVGIDEMHETRPPRLYIKCPYCSEEVTLYGQTPKRRNPHEPLKQYPFETFNEFVERISETMLDNDLTINAARKSVDMPPIHDGYKIEQTIIDEESFKKEEPKE